MPIVSVLSVSVASSPPGEIIKRVRFWVVMVPIWAGNGRFDYSNVLWRYQAVNQPE